MEAQVTERKNFVSIYWDYENISKIENRAKLLNKGNRQHFRLLTT